MTRKGVIIVAVVGIVIVIVLQVNEAEVVATSAVVALQKVAVVFHIGVKSSASGAKKCKLPFTYIVPHMQQMIDEVGKSDRFL